MPTINVDIDVDLSDFETEDLIEELEDRGKYEKSVSAEYVEEARHCLLRHNPEEALIYIERALYGNKIIGRTK